MSAITKSSVNKRIIDGNYDKTLAVRCVNGTFVGRKEDSIISWKGIPFVGKQPVGDLRWKAPVEFAPDDGVYEHITEEKAPASTGTSATWRRPFPIRERTASI